MGWTPETPLSPPQSPKLSIPFFPFFRIKKAWLSSLQTGWCPFLQLASPIFEVALERNCSLRKSPIHSWKSDFLPLQLHPNPYINGRSSIIPYINPKQPFGARTFALLIWWRLPWQKFAQFFMKPKMCSFKSVFCSGGSNMRIAGKSPVFFSRRYTSTQSWLVFSASHASFLFGVYILLADELHPKGTIRKVFESYNSARKKNVLCFQGIQPLHHLQTRSCWWFGTIRMMFPPSETSRFMSTYHLKSQPKKKDIEKLWKVDVSVGCFRHERGAGKVTQH